MAVFVGKFPVSFAETNVLRIRTGERGVSLRSSPEVTEYNKIRGVHRDTELDVYDQVGGWFYVYYKGDWGYVMNDPELVTIIQRRTTQQSDQSTSYRNYPAPDSWGPSSSDTGTNVLRVRTGEQGVSLRSSPEVTEYNKIRGIHRDTELDVYGEYDGWFYVYYKGDWGYIMNAPQFVTVIQRRY